MPNNLKIVSTYRSAAEAYLGKATLLSRGIESHIADEHFLGIAPWLSYAIGGIKLKVCEADLISATNILNSGEPRQFDSSQCPFCQSKTIEMRKLTGFEKTLWLLSFLILMPLVFPRKNSKCLSCKRRW